MIQIPKKFKVEKAETSILTEYHKALDVSIMINTTDADFDRCLQSAKHLKCAIKNEIARRARDGDLVAMAYAQERKWPSVKLVSTAMAAE